eukprot:7220209-Pyramimonas_sp.AAC.1
MLCCTLSVCVAFGPRHIVHLHVLSYSCSKLSQALAWRSKHRSLSWAEWPVAATAAAKFRASLQPCSAIGAPHAREWRHAMPQ